MGLWPLCLQPGCPAWSHVLAQPRLQQPHALLLRLKVCCPDAPLVIIQPRSPPLSSSIPPVLGGPSAAGGKHGLWLCECMPCLLAERFLILPLEHVFFPSLYSPSPSQREVEVP